MSIAWPLAIWLFRPLRWLTIAASFVATLYVLLQPKPLDFRRDPLAILFVLIHAFLISRLVGRVRSESFGFLYAQGFSRKTVWSHLWVATIASVGLAWLPACLLILTPLRGFFQGALQNPWFPLMAATEWSFLSWAVLLYALVLPVFHYEWMRSSTPFRGLISGHALAIAYLVIPCLLADRLFGYGASPYRSGLIAVFAAVSLVLTIFGRWIHQRMEVQS